MTAARPASALQGAGTAGAARGGGAVSLPVVVVAGRPNVGKSTLVNRFVGRREAVVEERPGVTRDRKVVEAEWQGRAFSVVDTGGWLAGGDALDTKVSAQAERAIADADVVLFVVDVTVGVTEEDQAVARVVRRAGRPTIVVANKVDNELREADAWELVSLGLGDPFVVSALHGRGSGDLLDEVVRLLPPGPVRATARAGGSQALGPLAEPYGSDRGDDGSPADAGGHGEPDVDGEHDDEDGWGFDLDVPTAPARAEGAIPRVALVGRPNVGKSTLFNRLVGDERSVVHDAPGTTRDAIDTVVETPDGAVCFVDTAGMRRRSRMERGTEWFATLRALEALDASDIALLVIDATAGITHQDQRLAERVAGAGCPVVVVLNKWELVAPGEDRAEVLADVGDRLAFLGEAPVLRVSALTGLGVQKVLPAVTAAEEAYHRRIPTGELNRAVKAIQGAHPAPGARIQYAVQGASDPPTFTLFATGRLPLTYLRYVERGLREHFDLGNTPVKLRVRAKEQRGKRGRR